MSELGNDCQRRQHGRGQVGAGGERELRRRRGSAEGQLAEDVPWQGLRVYRWSVGSLVSWWVRRGSVGLYTSCDGRG